jgi:hypothetical protein
VLLLLRRLRLVSLGRVCHAASMMWCYGTYCLCSSTSTSRLHRRPAAARHPYTLLLLLLLLLLLVSLLGAAAEAASLRPDGWWRR